MNNKEKIIKEKYVQLISNAREEGSKYNWEKCIELYNEAFKLMIVDDDLLDLALAYLQIGQLYKCKNIIDSILNVVPNNPKAHYFLAIYYEEIKNTEEALEEYRKTTQLPGVKKEDKVEAFFAMGRIYDEQKLCKEAEDMYQEAILRSRHFYANLNLGSLYEKNGFLDLALEYTLKAKDISPNEVAVNFNLGVIYMRKRKYEEAIKYYLKEIELENGMVLAYYNLGLIYKEIYKDYEKAKLYYLEGIKKDKNEYNLWYNLGCLYAVINDYDNAYNCILYALTLSDTIIEVMNIDSDLVEFRKTEYYQKLIKI